MGTLQIRYFYKHLLSLNLSSTFFLPLMIFNVLHISSPFQVIFYTWSYHYRYRFELYLAFNFLQLLISFAWGEGAIYRILALLEFLWLLISFKYIYFFFSYVSLYVFLAFIHMGILMGVEPCHTFHVEVGTNGRHNHFCSWSYVELLVKWVFSWSMKG